jgi:hypothetical protein
VSPATIAKIRTTHDQDAHGIWKVGAGRWNDHQKSMDSRLQACYTVGDGACFWHGFSAEIGVPYLEIKRKTLEYLLGPNFKALTALPDFAERFPTLVGLDLAKVIANLNDSHAWAEDSVIQLAALAFNVEILIFNPVTPADGPFARFSGSAVAGVASPVILRFLLREHAVHHVYTAEFHQLSVPSDGHFWRIRIDSSGNGERSDPARP